MFSLLYPENAALLLTLISYLGFFTTGCVGFSILQRTDFDINYFLICLSSLIFGICFLVLELIYYLKYEFMDSFRNKTSCRWLYKKGKSIKCPQLIVPQSSGVEVTK